MREYLLVVVIAVSIGLAVWTLGECNKAVSSASGSYRLTYYGEEFRGGQLYCTEQPYDPEDVSVVEAPGQLRRPRCLRCPLGVNRITSSDIVGEVVNDASLNCPINELVNLGSRPAGACQRLSQVAFSLSQRCIEQVGWIA